MCIINKHWPIDRYPDIAGLNLVFFRSPSMMRWRQVAGPLRNEAEELSAGLANRLIIAMSPKLVIAIGLATFDKLAVAEETIRSASGRVLIKRGAIGNIPAIGVLHLTGARISEADRQSIIGKIT